MLAGAARQLANANHELKVENFQLRQLLDSQRNILEGERVNNAVLTDRLESERGNKHFRNFGIAVGTALASAGLLRIPAVIDGYTLALTLGGVLLLLVSWFTPTKTVKIAPIKEDES